MPILPSKRATPGVPVAERWSSRTALGFIMMCVGMFMAILDAQVVATSLPTIQFALDIHPSAISWIQTAYLIAEVIAIPLTGVLTRVLTMRWLFVSAVALFTLASVGCASSTTFAALIACRVAQGFTGGTLIPAVFAAAPGSHNAGRPSAHGRHAPQLGTKAKTTWSPTENSTPSPQASTTPAASCPMTIGIGLGLVPSITDRSEWQSPAAPTRTRISPAPGAASSMS